MFAIERNDRFRRRTWPSVSGDLTGRAHDGPDAVGSVKEHERRLLDNKGGLQTYRA
jgi:hypothetical protein